MMDKKLNDELYKKLDAEKEEYKRWLLTLPPEKILNNAYRFTIYEDIMMALDDLETRGRKSKMFTQNT